MAIKKSTTYDELSGVDFSQGAENVSRNRSPFCLNMISDNGKNPVKRCGWETVYNDFVGSVHGIWHTSINKVEYFLAHIGTNIYKLHNDESGAATYTLLKSGVCDKKGCGFFFRNGEDDRFYILSGGDYLMFDGNALTSVSDSAYIPTTVIARSPSGGGKSYEDINFLSGKRIEKFIGDGTKIYQLSYTDIASVDKVESLNSGGSIDTLTAGTDYTADLALGKITFVAAHTTPISGQDNIYITYTKEVKGYAERIKKCTVYSHYGVGGNNRVFLSGNEDYMAYDFWSDIYKPNYFPDLNFLVVGSANTAVKGYLKISDYQAIIKQSNQQDTTIFLRSGSIDNENNAVFTIKAGIQGIGAISKNCFVSLNDDPLFLSERGVYALTSNSITYEKTIKSRSYNIDTKLREELGLEKAVAVEYDGCYILSVNGHCYVLDGRKRLSAIVENSYSYECYYWDNVEATAFSVHNNILWFGTPNGKIRRFKTDVESIEKYSDDGAAIRAVWSTPYDDDGAVQNYKTMLRKGCLVVLSPYSQSSCKVYYGVDGNADKYINGNVIDISTFFDEIDFSRYTFNANSAPRELYFGKQQRRYKRIQLIFENAVANEGFGIHKIVKTYKVGGYSKNRR